MTDQPIRCAACHAASQLFIPDGATEPDRVVCPQCGASEDYGAVLRSLGEQAEVYAAKELQKAVKDNSPREQSGMFDVEFSFKAAKIKDVKAKFFMDLKE